MDFLKTILDYVLHVDHHLDQLITTMGPWIYVLLFVIIFCETGLVVTPFLPGDSLLFAIGTFAARPNNLNLVTILILLSIAAILGDTVNYWIGRFLGPKVFRNHSRFLNQRHLERTRAFYDHYGSKTIVLARFIPIIRTFAPFVAGIACMRYSKFMAFNVFGGLLWIGSLTLLGYFFGNIQIVQKNFGLVVIAIIVLSILPAIFEFFREKNKRSSTPGPVR